MAPRLLLQLCYLITVQTPSIVCLYHFYDLRGRDYDMSKLNTLIDTEAV